MNDDLDIKTRRPDQLLEDSTESIDLSRLFTRDMTSSGSFDIGSGIWKTTFGKVLQALPIPALLIDRSCRVITANQACARISPEYESILGASFSGLFSDQPAASKVESLIEEVFSTRKPQISQGILQIDKRTVWVRMTFRSIRIVQERFLLILAEDMTAQKRQILLAQKHNEELRKEFARREAAERKLAEKGKQWRTVVETAGDIIFLTDANGFLTFVNPAGARISGYSEKELIGKHYLELIHPEHRKPAERFYGLQFVKKLPDTYYEFPFVTKKGETVWVGQHVQLQTEGGAVVGFQSICRDITDRKRAEENLRIQEQRFKILSESAPYGLVMIDRDGTFLYINPKFTELFGYGADEVPNGKEWFRRAYPDPDLRHAAISTWVEDLSGSPPGQQRSRISKVTCKDGSKKIIHFRPVQLDTGEHLMTCEDVTERELAEKQIKASIKEKEVLLREIHHRVKNNLAVIISLLRLQCRYLAHRPAAEIFADAQDRIRSIALAHEKLYQSESLGDLNVGEYVGSLVDHLIESSGVVGRPVTLKKDIEEVSFGLDTAVPLGFIVTELITNCLKHAFPEGTTGEIRMSLRSVGEREFELIVSDNGVGIPEDVSFEDRQSLGFALLDVFVRQLEGEVEIDRDEGTKVRIVFLESHDR